MLCNPQFSRRSAPQSGYMLLMLMLVVTLLAIAAAAIVPTMAFQIRRDREEELIHRGVQYSRAIRRYVKKFGRYPTRLEELEDTNHLRFLRRQYKDPISGKDFKLLHLGEVQVNFGAGVAGAASPGANPGVPTLGGAAPIGITGAQSNQPSTTGMTQPGAGVRFSSAADTSQPEKNTSDVKLSSQVFGGGPIVGVVSISKDSSIREFNKKKHYDQWQFIYDPSTDRGGLLNTPMQPPLQGAVQNIQTGPAGAIPAQPQQQQPQPVQQPQAEQPQAEPPQ